MAVIAANCPHIRVCVVDLNKRQIESWMSEDLPIFEPGLLDLVHKARGRNLFFSTHIDEEIIKVSRSY